MNLLASREQLRASLLRWVLLLVPVTLLLGFISSAMSGAGSGNLWYDALIKPDMHPPRLVFSLSWAVLHGLLGVALALVCSAWGAAGRGLAITVFGVQLVLNLAWPPVFFAAHQITLSLWLIGGLAVVTAITIALFWRIRWLAGALLLPYLAWVLFAGVLTWQILELNPQADGRSASGAVERISL